jgi:hypothetical protein
LFQAKAVRWSGDASLRAVFAREDGGEAGGGDFAGADIDEGADHIAHHLVEKIVAFYGDAETIVGKWKKFDAKESANAFSCGKGALIAECGKIMSANQVGCGFLHRV